MLSALAVKKEKRRDEKGENEKDANTYATLVLRVLISQYQGSGSSRPLVSLWPITQVCVTSFWLFEKIEVNCVDSSDTPSENQDKLNCTHYKCS